MDSGDSRHLLVAFRKHGVWETADGGATWSGVPMRFDPPPFARTGPAVRREQALPVILDAAWDTAPYGRRVFLATNLGVVIEGLGVLNEGLESLHVTSIDYSRLRQKLLVGTAHHGVFALDMPSLGRGTAGMAPAAVGTSGPTGRAILTCSPNPFTTTVSIRFAPSRDGAPLSLSVFDLSGRRVRMLWSGSAAAGESVASWDGRDDQGRRAAAGIYFLRLNADGERLARRIVKLR
jgi:hypothetical protein